MSDYDKDFLMTINESYPYERFIVSNPKRINGLFDDVKLTELFVPSTELPKNPDLLDSDGYYLHNDDIYVKLECKGVEFRMAYFDFNENLRENIRDIVSDEFGAYEWECMYVDHEDLEPLKKTLLNQYRRILKKYGECNVKPNFKMTSTINLISNFDITTSYSDIFDYIDTLNDKGDKWRNAMDIAKHEYYDKGKNPNEYIEEIINKVESLKS